TLPKRNSTESNIAIRRRSFSLRGCLKIAFGVPASAGRTAPLTRALKHFTILRIASVEPAEAGTPSLRLRISIGFVRHAVSENLGPSSKSLAGFRPSGFLRVSGFGFLSGFGIRVSDFELLGWLEWTPPR